MVMSTLQVVPLLQSGHKKSIYAAEKSVQVCCIGVAAENSATDV